MDKTAIKNFAVWARVKLMEDIRTRLGFLGITEEEIADPLPASTSEVQYYAIGADHPIAIKGVAIRQRAKIAEELRNKAKESDYTKAFQNFVEASAYDWFNRLIAIRYMEINEYAPLDVRLLSSVEKGKQDPDLVSSPFDGSLEYTGAEEQKILELKEQHDNNKLFRFLLFKMCNELHKILPGIFEGKEDASELLMRQSFIDKDGIIYHLVNDIPEEDWKDQVQIIGWIYQYYNSQLKDQIFAKKQKVTKDELPAVTQLFTPDWIVRYMVENSLGRLWIEHLRALDPTVDEKAKAEEFGWKYYLPEAKQEPEVDAELKKIREENYAQLKPEDLICLDPCMGSGHILVYMFDVLEQIYTSVGYSERDAAKTILENNIYGLDIDDRAYQLAYFAVMMKARQYNRRILSSEIKPHVYSIQESNGITREQLQEMGSNLTPEEKSMALLEAEKLVDLFHDAKEYGSILNVPEMDWDLLRRFTGEDDSEGQITLNFNAPVAERMNQLIDQGEVMAKKYWVTCTNPPYAAVSNLTPKVKDFIKDNYLNGKPDLFSAFIEKCLNYTKGYGMQAMITMHTWMFALAFEGLRKEISSFNFLNMIHLGPRAFEEIGGEVVQTTSFVLRRTTVKNYITGFSRLVKENSQDKKESAFLAQKANYYFCLKNIFNIPGEPFAYWIPENLIMAFKGKKLGDISDPRMGLTTGQNDKYLRLWTEVEFDNIGLRCSRKSAIDSRKKWFPYDKGGEFRKWYGNQNYVVNWYDDGNEMQTTMHPDGKRIWAHNFNLEYNFKPHVSWNDIVTKDLSFRYFEKGFLFDSSAATVFLPETMIHYVLGYLNTNVVNYIAEILNPTIHFKLGDYSKLPLEIISRNEVTGLAKENVEASKGDWDAFETSWNFQIHPLVRWSKKLFDATGVGATMQSYYGVNPPKRHSPLELSFLLWQGECNERFSKLKANEEELNRIFINIYGLQDEFTPEEEDKDVTVRRADLRRDIRSLISYAIGCMFGRYSLDKEDLIYAGGDWKSVRDSFMTFLPDSDNVIPITDQKYLDDDVVERICEFLTDVYGADTLEENLDFIAKALGNKGMTSREAIRNYMLNDFFKDHCSIYSVTGSGKRPIYWLFDSGKQNAFKALVYMHRWDADTTGRVLLYAQKIQQKYETEIRAIDMMLDHITDSHQINTEEKRRDHLKKQLEELVDYEERLEHMANERIEIDLDDGVKVNHEKVQTDRNGKKYQILAQIK